MFKLIIFDFDGPILDSFGSAKNLLLKIRKKFIEKGIIDFKKLPRPKKESFILNWGYPGEIALQKIFPSFSNKEAKIFMDFWVKMEKQKKPPLVKGTKAALKEIKKAGLKTALLTARSHNLGVHFGGHSLEKYFDFFQSFGSINGPASPQEKVHPNHLFHPSAKDHPNFFDKILKWAKEKNINLEEMLFIDDTLVGLKIARQIGLKFLGVCTGPIDSKKAWQKYGNLDKKYVIKSIAELPTWLRKYERV